MFCICSQKRNKRDRRQRLGSLNPRLASCLLCEPLYYRYFTACCPLRAFLSINPLRCSKDSVALFFDVSPVFVTNDDSTAAWRKTVKLADRVYWGFKDIHNKGQSLRWLEVPEYEMVQHMVLRRKQKPVISDRCDLVACMQRCTLERDHMIAGCPASPLHMVLRQTVGLEGPMNQNAIWVSCL